MDSSSILLSEHPLLLNSLVTIWYVIVGLSVNRSVWTEVDTVEHMNIINDKFLCAFYTFSLSVCCVFVSFVCFNGFVSIATMLVMSQND